MTVTGGLELADDALLLTVSDEGSGFPETFPNPQRKGAGNAACPYLLGFWSGVDDR
jgi:two-component sensor histidine kinase